MTALYICALLRSGTWRDLDSRNSQVVFLWEFSQSDGIIPFGTSDIPKIFNIQGQHVSSIRHKTHLKKNLFIVHPPLTHIKKKMSFTSFKTVLILGIMLVNARY
jgi:hypothetical protein